MIAEASSRPVSQAPAAIAFGVLFATGLAASLIYDYGWQWGVPQGIRSMIAPVVFAVLMGGGALVMAVAVWQGLHFWRALAWASLLPAIWLVKEIVLVLQIHGQDGLAFSLQLVVFLGFAGVVAAGMTVADILALIAAKLFRRPTPGLAFHLLMPLLAIACFAGAYLCLQSYGAPQD